MGDLLKIRLQVSSFEGKESTPPGFIGHASQDFVAALGEAAAVRTDSKDRDLSTLRHGDGFFARVLALVIKTVANDDENPPQVGLRGWKEQQLLLAGEKDRVIKGRATASLEVAGGLCKLVDFIRIILQKLGLHIK